MHHAFLYIFFLLSHHDYDVKLPNFTFFFKLLMTSTVPTCN